VLAAALGGLTAAVPLAPASAAPDAEALMAPAPSRWQKVTLNDRPGEPMSLAVLPDTRVLHTARDGSVRIHDPKTGLNTLAAKIPVYLHDEEGLQGVAVDPDFKRNNWVYLYYSVDTGETPEDDPLTPDVNEGDAPFDDVSAEDVEAFKGPLRLSRFKLVGNELDLSTEQQIIDVEVDRGICCHVGGQIDFDREGNLYLSTGDDSNPFESDGYSPVDDREGRHPAFDARRTSGNTNDLRGKLLRIKVGEDGGYSIPEGNLFDEAEDTEDKTRPEIYAMGLRNPFRFAVDRRRDVVYMADYSPDAADPDPERGPQGHGRWMVIDEPANYGWPFCVRPDLPYQDWNFATEESEGTFDCSAPVNDSPHNTGLEVLPPVAQSEFDYTYAPQDEGAGREIGEGGIGPMAGPAYVYNGASTSRIKWPRFYNGASIFYEWTRNSMFSTRVNDDNSLKGFQQIITPQTPVVGPIDMEFGPDGALYVLEYGNGYFAELPEAQLARIDYTRGNYTPVPKVAADVVEGQTPLTVRFSTAGTTDADGDDLFYKWDFDADGRIDSRKANPTFTYTEDGAYDATVKVIDRTGRAAVASVQVIVGNQAPQVEFVTPTTGDEFAFGDAVRFEVRITDDQPVDCNNVIVSYVLGHDDHGHPLTAARGCSGTIQTPLETGHAGASNLRGVFQATYTDAPGEGLPARSGVAEVVLEPSNG
jgi:glucose/arabinose dehydrogenase